MRLHPGIIRPYNRSLVYSGRYHVEIYGRILHIHAVTRIAEGVVLDLFTFAERGIIPCHRYQFLVIKNVVVVNVGEVGHLSFIRIVHRHGGKAKRVHRPDRSGTDHRLIIIICRCLYGAAVKGIIVRIIGYLEPLGAHKECHAFLDRAGYKGDDVIDDRGDSVTPVNGRLLQVLSYAISIDACIEYAGGSEGKDILGQYGLSLEFISEEGLLLE